MAFSLPPATRGVESTLHDPLASHVEVVWGAPSDEMLEAEARGDIILIEDLQRRHTPHRDTTRHKVSD
jgi:hypothetical protein